MTKHNQSRKAAPLRSALTGKTISIWRCVLLTPHQAEVASEAILEPKRQQLAKKKEKRRKWRAGKQKVLVGFLGLVFGGMLGDYFFGDVYPWNIVGFGISLVIAAIFQRFHIPVNK